MKQTIRSSTDCCWINAIDGGRTKIYHTIFFLPPTAMPCIRDLSWSWCIKFGGVSSYLKCSKTSTQRSVLMLGDTPIWLTQPVIPQLKLCNSNSRRATHKHTEPNQSANHSENILFLYGTHMHTLQWITQRSICIPQTSCWHSTRGKQSRESEWACRPGRRAVGTWCVFLRNPRTALSLYAALL